MKILKSLVAVMAVGVFSLSLVACGDSTAKTSTTAGSETSKIVVAKVGTQEIYKEAFDQEMAYVDMKMQWQYGEGYKNNAEAMAEYEAQKPGVIEYLVELEVLAQKALESESASVTDEEVDEELKLNIAEFDSESDFNQALKDSGLTREGLKENIEKTLRIQKFLASITDSIEVTEEEAKSYYEANLEAFKVEAGAEMSHILVETEEIAQEVKTKCDAGESFEELAKAYSLDGTKSNGGHLGYLSYSDTNYDSSFMAAAQTLKEGEVSAPVQSKFGWHLIKVENIQSEAATMSFEDAQEDIIEDIANQKQNELFNDNLEQWKSEMTIETYPDRV